MEAGGSAKLDPGERLFPESHVASPRRVHCPPADGGKRVVYIEPTEVKDHYIFYCEGEMQGEQARMAKLVGEAHTSRRCRPSPSFWEEPPPSDCFSGREAFIPIPRVWASGSQPGSLQWKPRAQGLECHKCHGAGPAVHGDSSASGRGGEKSSVRKGACPGRKGQLPAFITGHVAQGGIGRSAPPLPGYKRPREGLLRAPRGPELQNVSAAGLPGPQDQRGRALPLWREGPAAGAGDPQGVCEECASSRVCRSGSCQEATASRLCLSGHTLPPAEGPPVQPPRGCGASLRAQAGVNTAAPPSRAPHPRIAWLHPQEETPRATRRPWRIFGSS